MSINLHAAVRPAITALNADIQAVLERSAGWTVERSGKQRARYLQAESVMIQVQPLASRDIQHAQFLNLQGVLRIVFGYGSTEGIIRATQKGGDILRFAPYPGEPISTWLTSAPLEVWANGWSKVIATLQADPPQQL